MQEGYARLRIRVDLKHQRRGEIHVRVWFLEPIEGTPEDVERKWEEMVQEGGEEPGWRMFDRKVKVKDFPLEVALPKGFYAVEVSGSGYATTSFRVHLSDDVEVPLELYPATREGQEFIDYGIIYPGMKTKEMKPIEVLSARLRFEVRVGEKPARGAVVEFQLLDPLFDVPEELQKWAEEEKREEGYVVWNEWRAGVGGDGVVDVVLPVGFYSVYISKKGFRDVSFGILLAADTELPPINLKEGEEPLHLGCFFPNFAASPKEGVREIKKGVKEIPVKLPTANIQFEVLLEEKPAKGAVVEFGLVQPLFEVPEKLKKMVEREGGGWGGRRVRVGEDSVVNEALPVGVYRARVSMKGCRDAIFGFYLSEDLRLPPIRLKRGRGKPIEIGIFFPTEIVRGSGEQKGDSRKEAS